MTRRRIASRLSGCAAVALAAACAPIVPQRSLPGGSARWAEDIALRAAVQWAPDVILCRVSGAGIGADGWLPDRGGYWQFTYWSASKPRPYEATIDSEGRLRAGEIASSPLRGKRLPAGWLDSPKIWSLTRNHQASEPVHTFDAELAPDAEPERYPGAVVWRIRFWREDRSYETHVVEPSGRWLAVY